MNWKEVLVVSAIVIAAMLGVVIANGAVVVPEEVLEHNLVVVTTDVEGVAYSWFVRGPRGLEQRKPSGSDKAEIVFTGPPGRYSIDLTVWTDSGEPSEASGYVTIVKGDVPPDPDPDPDPGPPDPPLPPPNQKWQIVIVYESNDLDNYSANQVAIIKGLAFRKRLAEAGHKLVPGGITDQHVLDRNRRPPASLAPFLDACKGDKLPRICISPRDTRGVVQDFPLPADADAVLAFLKGATQ